MTTTGQCKLVYILYVLTTESCLIYHEPDTIRKYLRDTTASLISRAFLSGDIYSAYWVIIRDNGLYSGDVHV